MKHKNKSVFNIKSNLFFLIIIFGYISLIYSSNYISMNIFNYNNEQINLIQYKIYTVENFIKTKIQNPLYSKIKIGDKPQEIITWINSEEYSYFIFKDTCIIDSYYNEINSLTFEPNYEQTFFYNGYGETIYINETIELNYDINNEKNNKEIKIKKFPIMFMKDPKNDEFFLNRFSLNDITGKTCATIGLRFIENYHDLISKNFLLVLKDKDIIDDYLVFLEYDKNGNEKNLILGGYVEEIYKNKIKYSLENQRTTHIKVYNRFKPQWGIKCDKILSGNVKIEKEDVAFHHNLGVIYGPKEYQNHIESKFFNYYYGYHICNKKVDETYTIFYCDKEKFTIDEMKKFPELKFVKVDIEESFNLTYTDIFFTKGSYVYFLIVFNHIYDEIWELGKPFLSKYTFVYNFDSKLINYYKDIEGDNEEFKKEKKMKNFNNNKKKKFIYLIIIFSLFLGLICFFIGRILYNKKRSKLIKAKELEQNFSYQKYNNRNINNENRLIEE